MLNLSQYEQIHDVYIFIFAVYETMSKDPYTEESDTNEPPMDDDVSKLTINDMAGEHIEDVIKTDNSNKNKTNNKNKNESRKRIATKILNDCEQWFEDEYLPKLYAEDEEHWKQIELQVSKEGFHLQKINKVRFAIERFLREFPQNRGWVSMKMLYIRLYRKIKELDIKATVKEPLIPGATIVDDTHIDDE